MRNRWLESTGLPRRLTEFQLALVGLMVLHAQVHPERLEVRFRFSTISGRRYTRTVTGCPCEFNIIVRDAREKAIHYRCLMEHHRDDTLRVLALQWKAEYHEGFGRSVEELAKLW